MKAAYFWPRYGQQDEICFTYYSSLCASHIQEVRGLSLPQDAVLQTDGYTAYTQYAVKIGATHSQCWPHARREISDAKDIEPGPAGQALEWIGAAFAVDVYIHDHHLTGAMKQAWRITHARPVVRRLFAWIDKHFERRSFIRSSPFFGTLAYLREWRVGLEFYLDDADVPIDTNHLAGALSGSRYPRCRNSHPVCGKFTLPAIRCSGIYTTSQGGAIMPLAQRLPPC